MSKSSLRGRLSVAIIISLTAFLSSASALPESDLAARIISDTGVKGGFVAHVGCGDGALTAALREAGDGYLVQGLDADAADVAKARARLLAADLYGSASADGWDGKRLPYIDGMVNLLVVEGVVSKDEITRVLAPRGVAYVKQGRRWTKTVQPVPSEIDDWTHHLYNAQGTMVGKDKKTGPPRRIQWVGGPKWLRNHDFMSSMNAMVSANGRIFYALDEGLRNHIYLPADWRLIARDAFSGAILWEHKMADWHPQIWPLKSGPADLPRKLVAVGDRVYCSMGYNAPVSALDAATGEVIHVYKDTKGAMESIVDGDAIFTLIEPVRQTVNYGSKQASYGEIGTANKMGWSQKRPAREIVAQDLRSGADLWRVTDKVAPLSLTACDDRVYYINDTRLVGLDRKSGKELWRSTGKEINAPASTGDAIRVIYDDGVVVVFQGKNALAFAADSGKQLWGGGIQPSGHHCPKDLFPIDGLLWSANTGTDQKKGTRFTALDLHTGKVERDLRAKNLPAFPMHPRCYPSRATESYIMLCGMGTEFYAPDSDTVDVNNHVRGSCIYGVMPANGLLYKPADSCCCYYQSKLEYFTALAPEAEGADPAAPIAEKERLVKGPAYAKASADKPATDAWPMYRRDVARSGSAPALSSTKIDKAWEAKLGGRLTQPIVAEGLALIASIDTHTVHALNADNGKEAWTFTAGGRVDSPPTVHEGTVIFGAADGYVYCLRASDGALVWKYLVALNHSKIVSLQQVESLWPVSGASLVFDGKVHALAGRHMFFDGGLRLAILDAKTGKLVTEQIYDEREPETGKHLQELITAKYMPVANPDIFSTDGDYLYMQAQNFDLDGKRVDIAPAARRAKASGDEGKHLFCQTGFLDDVWFHRSFWLYDNDTGEGWGNYTDNRKTAVCGRLIVHNDERAYAFRSENLGNTLNPRPTYQLYAADLVPSMTPEKKAPAPAPKKGPDGKRIRVKRGPKGVPGFQSHWIREAPPILVNAMVLAGDALVIAGPQDYADEAKIFGFTPGADAKIDAALEAQDAAWRGKKGGILNIVSTTDGVTIGKHNLDSIPVFDGMSAADGALFISMKNGVVARWGAK